MKSKRQRSLSLKLNLFNIAVILLIAGGLVWTSYIVYGRWIRDFYLQQVRRAAVYAKEEILEEYVEYLWNHINTDEYRELRNRAIEANDEGMIRDWMRSIPSVLYSTLGKDIIEVSQISDELNEAWESGERYSLYDDYTMLKEILEETAELFDISVAYIQFEVNNVTYNLIDPAENLFYVGSIESPIEEFEIYGDNEPIPATIYQSSFGWLCTTALTLGGDDYGAVIGTVGVDIDMGMVAHSRVMFLVNSAIYVVAFTLLAIIISMFLMRRIVIKPLRQLSEAAANFADDDDGLTMEDVIQLPINSNDEIGDLYHQIRAMEERIVGYTDHMTQITAERERVNTELNMAEKIQRDMLPDKFPAFSDRPEFDLYASMTPAREVGGDFYDFFMIDDTHLAFLIADVSDKGVPAALFMMASMILIKFCSSRGGTPAEILTEVNSLICRSSKSKMFVTAWMGILDLETGRMICTNAGHEYPFLRSADGKFHLFRDKHGLVIGGLEKTKYRDYELTLEPGDAVFVYTDGVPEANNINTEMFGLDRLEHSLNKAPKASSKEILEQVRADVDDFAHGAKQFDDLTMLCLEYKGPAARDPEDAA